MAVAFSAIGALLLIAIFIFQAGLPFILKIGPAAFLFSSSGIRRRASLASTR